MTVNSNAPMNPQDRPLTTLETHIGLAIAAIVIVMTRFPLGATNRPEDVDTCPPHELKEQEQLANQFRAYITGVTKLSPDDATLTFEALRMTQCGEMSTYAVQMLKKSYPKHRIERLTLHGGDHQMVVIGRAAQSDPRDITTWGKDAVIADPWARQFYEAHRFFNMQQKGPHFSVIERTVVNSSRIHIASNTNHLTGTPEIDHEDPVSDCSQNSA